VGDDLALMDEALAEARAAAAHDDVPIGAVVVRGGAVIARGHNRREVEHDPTAHAEVIALRAAGIALGRWRLTDSALYVTVEPCAMCAGAIVLARVPLVVFGAPDDKAGAVVSVAPADRAALVRLAAEAGVPAAVIGRTGGSRLSMTVAGQRAIDVAVVEAEQLWSGALGRFFAGRAA